MSNPTNRTFYALRHIPSGYVCDVENGVCYGATYTREQAQASIDAQGIYKENYEIIVMPEHLQPSWEAIAQMMNANCLDYYNLRNGQILIANVDGISLFNSDSGEFLEHVTPDTWMTCDAGSVLMRVIQLPDAGRTCRVVKVFFNTEVNEYECHLFISGGHIEAANYYTDCKADAFSTAIELCKQPGAI